MFAVDTWMAFMMRRGIASSARHPCLADEAPRWRYKRTVNTAVLGQVIRPHRPRIATGASIRTGARVERFEDRRPFVRARREHSMLGRADPTMVARMRATPWPDGQYYRLDTVFEVTPEYDLARQWRRNQQENADDGEW